MRASLITLPLAAAAFLLLAAPIAGQCPFDKLFAPDPDLGQSAHGMAVGVSGDWAVAGRLGQKVYVYHRPQAKWDLVAELKPGLEDIGDEFGTSVSIADDILLVGARRRDVAGMDSGAAFVFELVGGRWVETAMLAPSDGAPHDHFGHAVSMSRDIAVVGANQKGSFRGAAYVFERFDPGTPGDPFDDTWYEAAILEPDESFAAFGESVALSGQRILVGAPKVDVAGTIEGGAAYVFELGLKGWAKVARLVAPDPANFDYFGQAVALAGETALIGVPEDDPGAPSAGSVREFELGPTGWYERSRLVPPDPGVLHRFGAAVAVTGDLAVVGAPGDAPHGPESGSAYFFERGPADWQLTSKAAPPDGFAYSCFGGAVARDATTAFLGASHDPTLGMFAGAAYIYTTLCGAPDELSLAAGGTHTLTLSAGSMHAGEVYLVLASAAGAAPGFDFGGVHVPLEPDSVLLWTLTHAGQPPIASYLGVLDAAGEATAGLGFPAGLDPGLLGTSFYFAYGLFGPGLSLEFASTAESVTFAP